MSSTTRVFCALAGAATVWAVLTAPAAADSGAENYTLRYRFQPGETLRWEVVHRARIKTTVSGTTETAEMVSTSIKAWRVEDVQPDGKVTFEHRVESVDMWQKRTGHNEVRYNSQTDDTPPPGFEQVAGSVGVPLSEVTMDATGRILHRERNTKTHSAENEGPMTIPLPQAPVAVSESWSLPYQIDVPVGPTGAVKKIKTLQKYTLTGVSAGIATIRVATQILTPVHDPAVEAQLIQRQSSGTVRFDVDAGRVVGQQMDLDKQVVGFSGEASSLHYLTRFTEKLLPEASRTAARPKASAGKTE